jgi:hypothetical protein
MLCEMDSSQVASLPAETMMTMKKRPEERVLMTMMLQHGNLQPI